MPHHLSFVTQKPHSNLLYHIIQYMRVYNACAISEFLYGERARVNTISGVAFGSLPVLPYYQLGCTMYVCVCVSLPICPTAKLQCELIYATRKNIWLPSRFAFASSHSILQYHYTYSFVSSSVSYSFSLSWLVVKYTNVYKYIQRL